MMGISIKMKRGDKDGQLTRFTVSAALTAHGSMMTMLPRVIRNCQ